MEQANGSAEEVFRSGAGRMYLTPFSHPPQVTHAIRDDLMRHRYSGSSVGLSLLLREKGT